MDLTGFTEVMDVAMVDVSELQKEAGFQVMLNMDEEEKTEDVKVGNLYEAVNKATFAKGELNVSSPRQSDQCLEGQYQ